MQHLLCNFNVRCKMYEISPKHTKTKSKANNTKLDLQGKQLVIGS